MDYKKLVVSTDSLIDRLFQFIPGRQSEHKKFISEMILGILGARSVLLSNISRFLAEPIPFIHTEQRISKFLYKKQVPWSDLKLRCCELGSFQLQKDDTIAFDPGDLVKDYAEKMENLYRVHDGSEDDCGNGYEDFCAEGVQWVNGNRFQIPLYQRLSNARCPDYRSQNHQIIEAIQVIHEYVRDKGIWTFDRGHDRSRIFTNALFRLDIRWIIRAKENRAVIPEDPKYLMPLKYQPGLFDIVSKIKLTDQPLRLTFPQKSGELHVGWTRVKLTIDPDERWITVVVVHDKRNEKPVVLLTNLEVHNDLEATLIFGRYLERWRKEEGFRFCKSYLNTESIRTLSFNSISNLAWLAHLTYYFITLFYKGSPEQVLSEIKKRLKHFNSVDEIGYRYYRVADVMRILLWEQMGKPVSSLTFTEVG